MSRYRKRKKATNDVYQDEELFESRGVRIFKNWVLVCLMRRGSLEDSRVLKIEKFAGLNDVI